MFNARQTPYPNPGYLGSSSHAAIFSHISPDGDRGDTFQTTQSTHSNGDDHLIQQGADTLRQLLSAFPLKGVIELVSFWLAKGVNLALTGPFVAQCTESMHHLLACMSDGNWHLAYARQLLQNSARPLEFDQSSTLDAFSAQFLHQNTRWETLGLFFSAVSRATLDVSFFPSLYSTEKGQYSLRRMAMKLCDYILDICLSLDCLNDLQLLFQYENFIVHSHVDGDQSYHSWRRIGDVISSTFALGYHENLEAKPDVPSFLTEMRKTASARIYSADKNLAIFLGRPPRMCKRFCHLHLPSSWIGFETLAYGHTANADGDEEIKATYCGDTRWSVICASLKEDIMEMLRDVKDDTYIERATAIQEKARAEWDSLPPQFRLDGSLKQFTGNPFERDFVASVRLNHLQVLFLVHLLLLNSPAEPNASIIEVAQEMLSLVTETILLRDRLVNSGTSLIWKVAHFGLPAAGILLLAMLRQRNNSSTPIPWTKTIQDLNVFVAEVEIGTIIRPEDPNYALLSKATQTIQRFLDSVHSKITPQSRNEDWTALLNQDLWDSEFAFWDNMAGHPSLDPLPEV